MTHIQVYGTTEMPTSYERKKYIWGWKKVYWLEKQYFSFCFHRSVHKVILGRKKKVFWGILLKITSICNLKKVLNTAKKGTVGISVVMRGLTLTVPSLVNPADLLHIYLPKVWDIFKTLSARVIHIAWFLVWFKCNN